MDKILPNLHWLIIAYGLYAAFDSYTILTEEIQNIENQLPSTQAEIKEMERKLTLIDEYKKNLAAYQARVNNVFASIDRAKRQLPADISDYEMTVFFNDEANYLNIKDLESKPASEETRGFYIAKGYDVSAEMTFLQGLVFLERLGSADKILNIKTFKMDIGDRVARKRFPLAKVEVGTELYKYNPNFVEEK